VLLGSCAITHILECIADPTKIRVVASLALFVKYMINFGIIDK